MSDPLCENYLGKKGFTIKKSSISVDEQHNIRTKLTVRPYVPNSPVKGDELRFTVNRRASFMFLATSVLNAMENLKESKLPEPQENKPKFCWRSTGLPKEDCGCLYGESS